MLPSTKEIYANLLTLKKVIKDYLSPYSSVHQIGIILYWSELHVWVLGDFSPKYFEKTQPRHFVWNQLSWKIYYSQSIQICKLL